MKKNGIFGYTEFSSQNLSALPQWQRIVDFIAKNNAPPCTEDISQCQLNVNDPLGEFIRIIQVQHLSESEIIRQTNIFINKWSYITDNLNYNVPDYWATPPEFVNYSGDSEDFAIAKYYVLKLIGIDYKKLRIVTIYDTIRDTNHAVLAYYSSDNKIIILDSLTDELFEDSLYKHYIPQYSVNEETRWVHTAPLAAPLATPLEMHKQSDYNTTNDKTSPQNNRTESITRDE